MSGLQVLSSAVEQVKRPPTPAERRLLTELTAPGAVVSSLIPDEIDADQFYSTIGVVCAALSRAVLQTEMLLPVLGRLLDITQQHPELYKDRGYETYEAFLDKLGETYGVSRSSCFEARKMVQRFPDLTVSTYEKVGRVNMQILAKAIPPGDEKKPYAKKLIEKAAEWSAKELRQHCVDQNYIEAGETEGAYVHFACDKTRKRFIEKFLNDEDIQAFLETKDPGKMIARCIEESVTGWKAQIEDARGPR